MTAEQPRHLVARLEVTFDIGEESIARGINSAVLSDAGEYVLQPPARRAMGVDVIGRHQFHATLAGCRGQSDTRSTASGDCRPVPLDLDRGIRIAARRDIALARIIHRFLLRRRKSLRCWILDAG